jgi:hypothetical protein
MTDLIVLTSITVVSPNGQTEVDVADTNKLIELKYKIATAFGIDASGL